MSGAGSKAVIKNADMTDEMQTDAIDCATQARATPALRGPTHPGAPCTLHSPWSRDGIPAPDRPAAPAAPTSTAPVDPSATLLPATPPAHTHARTQALEKYNIEKDIAAYIKKEFDKKYNPTWHCIVGRNFGEARRGVAWRGLEGGPVGLHAGAGSGVR